MKKCLPLTLALLAALCVLPAAAAEPGAEPDARPYHARLLQGYADGSFRPDQVLTRAEGAHLLYGLVDQADRPDSLKDYQPFSDAPLPGPWFSPAVAGLTLLDRVHGYPDGTFRPNQRVTRAEFVAMLAPALPHSDPGGTPASLPDVSPDHWAYDLLSAATQAGWLTGDETGALRPDDPLTRAEAVAIAYRANGRNCDQAYLNSLDQAHLPSYPDLSAHHWAYPYIMEGSISHHYHLENGQEVWDEAILGA